MDGKHTRGSKRLASRNNRMQVPTREVVNVVDERKKYFIIVCECSIDLRNGAAQPRLVPDTKLKG
eukprot:5184211-Pleurochrysis_carterae.AAC.3